MKLAITDHAVDRFIERVRGAEKMKREEVRDRIRLLIMAAGQSGEAHKSATDPDQRLIPFKDSEGNELSICIGKNTTGFPGDVAVISILTGKPKEIPSRPFVEPLAVKLGDKFPQLKELVSKPTPEPASQTHWSKFIMHLKETPGLFYLKSEEELIEMLTKLKLKPEQVSLYRLQEFKLKTVVELE